jgi:hypothetical protein
MWDTRASKFVLVAGTLILLGGCQNVGPIAIDQGRDRYNSIIELTSKEQAFANIIRVYHHDPTAFMDVTEVDATTTFSGTVAGGLTNIGARAGTSGGTLAGQTGSVAGGVTYSESPLIRYQPLLGQALVAQLVTPVSPDALVQLYDSHWPPMPLLDFATSYMTVDADETYAALNIISQLDQLNAVQLAAEKSDLNKAKDAVSTGTIPVKGGNVTLEVTNKASGGGGNDALVIYRLPYHPHATASEAGERRKVEGLWNMLIQIYASTQPKSAHCPPSPLHSFDLDGAANCSSIELRTMPVARNKVTDEGLNSGMPLMRTYSALGILKNATEDATEDAQNSHPRIAFIDLEKFNRIRGYAWNRNSDEFGVYTILPEDESEGTAKDPMAREVEQWLAHNSSQPFVYRSPNPRASFDDFIKGNRTLGHLRRYVLIIEGSEPPLNAYVAHFDHGTWYYIDRADITSQKNFNLVSLFMTMMAAPPTTPPLTPSISVGGG